MSAIERSKITPGLEVQIVQKQDQESGDTYPNSQESALRPSSTRLEISLYFFGFLSAGSQEISRAERLLGHPSLDELFEGTGDDSGPRDQRIYEAFRLHGYTLFQIQEYLGLRYSTISRIVPASSKRVCQETRADPQRCPERRVEV